MAQDVQSPCIQICTLNPERTHCLGCGRSLQEITEWGALSDDQRAEIMGQLRVRLPRLHTPPNGQTSAAD